jgi:hypothetical protein
MLGSTKSAQMCHSGGDRKDMVLGYVDKAEALGIVGFLRHEMTLVFSKKT